MSDDRAQSSGHTIALLHGVNNTPFSWRKVREQLTRYETVAPALPAVDHLDAIASQLLENLPPSFVLVGHSLGGYVALQMLRQQPDRIRAIALVNSSDQADSASMRSKRAALAERALGGEYATMTQAATAVSYAPANLNNDELMQERARSTAEYGATAYAAHQRAAAVRRDQREILRSFSGPKLIIAGKADAVISPADQRAMADQTQSEFVEIADAGHMLPMEQPFLLARALSDWLGASA